MVPFMMVVVVLIILVRGKRREFVNYFFALGEIPKSNSSNGEEHEYIQTTYHSQHKCFYLPEVLDQNQTHFNYVPLKLKWVEIQLLVYKYPYSLYCLGFYRIAVELWINNTVLNYYISMIFISQICVEVCLQNKLRWDLEYYMKVLRQTQQLYRLFLILM